MDTGIEKSILGLQSVRVPTITDKKFRTFQDLREKFSMTFSEPANV